MHTIGFIHTFSLVILYTCIIHKLKRDKEAWLSPSKSSVNLKICFIIKQTDNFEIILTQEKEEVTHID